MGSIIDCLIIYLLFDLLDIIYYYIYAYTEQSARNGGALHSIIRKNMCCSNICSKDYYIYLRQNIESLKNTRIRTIV